MIDRATFVRDRFTVLGYGSLVVFSLAMSAVGPAMPLIRSDLGISRTVGGLHFTALAAGSVIAGLGTERLIAARSRRWAVTAGGTGVAVGGLVVALGPHPALTIAGALVFGTFGNVLLVSIQAALSDHHGPARATVITEAGALMSLVFLVPGLVLGALGFFGAGWRPVFVLPLLAWLIVVRPLMGALEPMHEEQPSDVSEGRRRGYRPAFWALMLAVAIEWSIAGWAAGYLVDRGGLSESAAAAAAVAFYASMALGRFVGSRLTQRLPIAVLLPWAVAVALVGFMVFWQAPGVLGLMAGRGVAGLGVALLFPLVTAALFEAAPGAANRASAHVSLAGGTAVMIAPLTLGALADRWGLRPAFGGVLVLILALAVTVLWWRSVADTG